jgi:hypothetical protein
METLGNALSRYHIFLSQDNTVKTRKNLKYIRIQYSTSAVRRWKNAYFFTQLHCFNWKTLGFEKVSFWTFVQSYVILLKTVHCTDRFISIRIRSQWWKSE